MQALYRQRLSSKSGSFEEGSTLLPGTHKFHGLIFHVSIFNLFEHFATNTIASRLRGDEKNHQLGLGRYAN